MQPPPPPGPPMPQQPGGVPPGLYVDPANGLALPNGTALAPVGRRVGAYFLSIVLVIVTLGIGYVIWGLIIWSRGQTPALQVLGMRCWHPDSGRVPGWGRMALREIIGRLVDNILSVITQVISLVLMCTRPDRRTLHDLVAGTVVVHDPQGVLKPR
jgi:uncharacterized RDD family membrane protein YckC